jgi:hypothetical protein
MKPSEWDKMNDDERTEMAGKLFHSTRGLYIIGQALEYAIHYMKEIPAPWTEVSNIQDMETLRECLFNFPFIQIVTPEDIKEREKSLKL